MGVITTHDGRKTYVPKPNTNAKGFVGIGGKQKGRIFGLGTFGNSSVYSIEG